jgi:hypothetical protein
MRKKINSLLFLLSATLIAIGCQQSDFSGESAKKPPKAAAQEPNLTNSEDLEKSETEDPGEDKKDPSEDQTGGSESDNIDDTEAGENTAKSGDDIKDTFSVRSNKGKIDVLLFFDQSGSMQKYISEVAKRLNAFVQKFSESKKNLDYRILVVAKDYSLPIQNERIGHVRIGIGNHNAIDVFKDLVTGKVNPGSVKLRRSSVKEFVVVSNDNSSQNASDFGAWARANRNKVGRIHINGFIGFKSTGPLGYLGNCYIDKAGTNYIEMTKHKYLGGLAQDMCSGNWDTLIDNLGKKITDIETNVFDLSEEPVVDSIIVKVDNEALTKSSWNYSEDGNAVEITSTLNPDSKISISYTKK